MVVEGSGRGAAGGWKHPLQLLHSLPSGCQEESEEGMQRNTPRLFNALLGSYWCVLQAQM